MIDEVRMKIRNATENDAAQLTTLLAQMGSKFEMSLKAMTERISAFNSKGHQILVAEMNDSIIGLIAFGCYEQFRISGSCCHIDTLVIDSKYRGQGVGKKLIASAEKYATEYGAITIELITANFRRNSGTHSFYKSLGYKDHLTLDYSYFSKERKNKNIRFQEDEKNNSVKFRSLL